MMGHVLRLCLVPHLRPENSGFCPPFCRMDVNTTQKFWRKGVMHSGFWTPESEKAQKNKALESVPPTRPHPPRTNPIHSPRPFFSRPRFLPPPLSPRRHCCCSLRPTATPTSRRPRSTSALPGSTFSPDPFPSIPHGWVRRRWVHPWQRRRLRRRRRLRQRRQHQGLPVPALLARRRLPRLQSGGVQLSGIEQRLCSPGGHGFS